MYWSRKLFMLSMLCMFLIRTTAAHQQQCHCCCRQSMQSIEVIRQVSPLHAIWNKPIIHNSRESVPEKSIAINNVCFSELAMVRHISQFVVVIRFNKFPVQNL